ncbi:multidrug transporter MatE [Kosmotoga arenicorallina S304]|uniref:Multidrug export protein MepA n=2 Tax=Kosmotoga arenicorallina TaxID=688066 RepID=A0A176JXG4_9BACT|nr:multidrug transporter MatE [Kosmotoga arenicorallina S304]
MMDRQRMLAEERIGKLLVKLSVPAMIGMLVQALYNFVDTIFVGRGVGSLGIAGITISFPVQIFVMAFAQLIGIGGASIISRSLGAGDKPKANRTAGNIFTVVIFFGLIMALMGLIFLKPILTLLGASPTIMPYAADYLGIILFGTFFFSFAMATNSVVRAEGNARVAMYTMLISAILNIILDPIFIFGLDLGVKGAALATVISQATTAFYLLYYFLSGKSLLHIKSHDLKPEIPIIKESFAIGFSAFVRQAAGSVLGIIMNNTLVAYGGDIAVAVFGVINRLLMVFLMPMFGINQGFMPILGFNYGAKKLDRVLRVIKLATIAESIISILAFTFLFSFPGFLIGIFSKDSELILIGSDAMRKVILMLPLIGFQVIGAGMFQALGKAFPALILSMARQILFLIPIVLVLPHIAGLDGVWFSFPIADVSAFLITFVLFIKQIRNLKSEIGKAAWEG